MNRILLLPLGILAATVGFSQTTKPVATAPRHVEILFLGAPTANQAAYLTFVGTRAHACGYQGVQWWQHADVHWGDAVQDHFGLWGDFRQIYPGRAVPEPDAMAMRPAGQAMRALNLNAPRAACTMPADWKAPLFGAGVSGAKFRYYGKVFDQKLRAVPYAMLSGRLNGGGNVYFTVHAD